METKHIINSFDHDQHNMRDCELLLSYVPSSQVRIQSEYFDKRKNQYFSFMKDYAATAGNQKAIL